MDPILELSEVSVDFQSLSGHEITRAVSNVEMQILPGEAVGIIGESGSGKSTLLRALLKIVDPAIGQVKYMGQDLAKLNKREVKSFHSEVSCVFQEPFESLNPSMKIGRIIAEPLLIRRDLGRDEITQKVRQAMKAVNLDLEHTEVRPARLSGGQQQRVGIARALVVDPRVVLLDEPTSSLDVSTRAQILNLLRRLRTESGLTYVFVSHDIDTVAYICDRIYVMRQGQVIEHGTSEELLGSPKEEYTKMLLGSRLSV